MIPYTQAFNKQGISHFGLPGGRCFLILSGFCRGFFEIYTFLILFNSKVAIIKGTPMNKTNQ